MTLAFAFPILSPSLAVGASMRNFSGSRTNGRPHIDLTEASRTPAHFERFHESGCDFGEGCVDVFIHV